MFRFFVLGLVAGLVIFYQLREFPSWRTLLIVSLCIVLALTVTQKFVFNNIKSIHLSKITAVIIQSSLGILAAFWLACVHFSLTPTLPEQVLDQKVTLIGEIIDLPQAGTTLTGKHKITFWLKVNQIDGDQQVKEWKGLRPKIRLSWYGVDQSSLPSIIPGQVWQFRAKLKTIHASLNPGGFDYEQYMFRQGVQATGYVLNQQAILQQGSEGNLRFLLAQRLDQQFSESPFAGIYHALLIGDKSRISQDQWEVFQTTGTIHLMAISGLHIGIIAAIGFVLFGGLWRWLVLWAPWFSKLPKVYWASTGALLLATFYMALAGYSIPTQRAWLMVVAILVFVVIRRKFQPWSALALAALLILLVDPKSVMAPGFWLSFTAVAIIFSALQFEFVTQFKKWQKLLWIQLWLTIGLIPALAFLYMQIPSFSLFANLVVVPLVSVLALPLLFLSVLIGNLFSELNPWLLTINDGLWQIMWTYLSALNQLDGRYWLTGSIAVWKLGVAYWFLFLVMWSKKRSLLLRTLLLVLVWWGLLWLPDKTSVKQNEFVLSVLDVGQGQAVVIETAYQTWVIDTGAKWSDKLDGATMAILPYLKSRRIQQIDVLIVSHSDNDHAGGLESLMKAVRVQQIYSGQAKLLNHQLREDKIQPCFVGQAWESDGVRLEVLSPTKDSKPRNDNDASCVVRVSVGDHSVLIPGDASKRIERAVIQNSKPIASDILIAGHHGSKTSTGAEWLAKVQPEWVVFSAGYQNRYHFPNREVVKRVENSQAKWLNTACDGGIHFFVTKQDVMLTQKSRDFYKHWYHHRCLIEKPINERN